MLENVLYFTYIVTFPKSADLFEISNRPAGNERQPAQKLPFRNLVW